MTAYATAAMHSRLLLNQNVHVLNCIHCQKAFAGAELYNSSSSVIINWKDIKKTNAPSLHLTCPHKAVCQGFSDLVYTGNMHGVQLPTAVVLSDPLMGCSTPR